MGRKIALALLLCALALALSGCASEQLFPEVTAVPPGYGMPTPTVEPADEWQGYDPSSEEEGDVPFYEDITPNPAAEATVTAQYSYAGSTPMPLDPIDMPTPTPRRELAFTYQTYEATELGLKFEGPAGWEVTESTSDTFTLTEPADQQKDNFTAFMTIRATGVSSQYNTTELKQEVLGMLETIGSTNYSPWEPSNTAARTLLDHDGIYANYAGTLPDGTRVRGRVHVTCINKVLYSVHVAHPAGYNTDYLNNFGKLRDTITITR